MPGPGNLKKSASKKKLTASQSDNTSSTALIHDMASMLKPFFGPEPPPSTPATSTATLTSNASVTPSDYDHEMLTLIHHYMPIIGRDTLQQMLCYAWEKGTQSGYMQGYDEGYAEGHRDTSEMSYDEGWMIGYQPGESQGEGKGYEEGLRKGEEKGRRSKADLWSRRSCLINLEDYINQDIQTNSLPPHTMCNISIQVDHLLHEIHSSATQTDNIPTTHSVTQTTHHTVKASACEVAMQTDDTPPPCEDHINTSKADITTKPSILNSSMAAK